MTLPVRSGTGYCAALWCNNSKSKHPNLSFFRFPKDEERCKAWLKYSRRDDLLDLSPDQLYSGYRLCSQHFDKTQYTTVLKKGKLVKAACPNVGEDEIPPPQDDKSSDSKSIEKESNISSSSNVVSLLLECETASSEIIPVPQKSYLTVNADVVTLMLECESEPYVS